MSKDHVTFWYRSLRSQISRLVQRLKGKTAYKMLQESAVAEAVLGPALLGRGYF